MPEVNNVLSIVLDSGYTGELENDKAPDLRESDSFVSGTVCFYSFSGPALIPEQTKCSNTLLAGANIY